MNGETDMETLNQDIKSGNFKRFYLLFGEEEFLKQSYKKRLRQAVAGNDTMNYNYFEGKGLDVRELISLANTMPFFSDRRLIMVEDSGFFKAVGRAGGGSSGHTGYHLYSICRVSGR